MLLLKYTLLIYSAESFESKLCASQIGIGI